MRFGLPTAWACAIARAAARSSSVAAARVIVVQPLWLDYGPDTTDIAWVGEEPGLDNFMRVLARARPLRLTLHFLAPLEGEALANRKAIAGAAQAAILQAMDQRVAL